MNTKETAQAIKNHLINLAASGRLPEDLTQLNADAIENILIGHMTFDKRIVKASMILYCEDLPLYGQIKLIEACEDEHMYIDHIEGVSVCLSSEYTYTVAEFLNSINS